MTNDKLKNTIRQSVDLHVHIGPEVIPRKYTVEKLLREEQGQIAGIALKNHFYPTTPLIQSIENRTQIKLIGSVTLNNFVGGINPEAIYSNSLLSNSPTIVWMPTTHAKQFLDNSKYEIAPEWVAKESFTSRKANEVQPVALQEVAKIFKTIQKCRAILATGHISWRQSSTLVQQAKKAGVKKIIITHPIYQRIDMPIKTQQQLTKLKDVFVEHCYSMYAIDKIPIDKIVEQIHAVGPRNCILSSDVGQIFSPAPSKALYLFSTALAKAGISQKALRQMLVNNPRKIISVSDNM